MVYQIIFVSIRVHHGKNRSTLHTHSKKNKEHHRSWKDSIDDSVSSPQMLSMHLLEIQNDHKQSSQSISNAVERFTVSEETSMQNISVRGFCLAHSISSVPYFPFRNLSDELRYRKVLQNMLVMFQHFL